MNPRFVSNLHLSIKNSFYFDLDLDLDLDLANLV